jgi:hypothetical protein
MGRTPEPFGSMVPDPRILCEFMGHKRGPLGSFSWVEFTNLWAEPLQAHLYVSPFWVALGRCEVDSHEVSRSWLLCLGLAR